MNFFNKFLFKKYIGTKLTFVFSTEPVETKAMHIAPYIKINGTKYWSGTINNELSKHIIGSDIHLYIRINYEGKSIRTRKIISLSKTIRNIPIMNILVGDFMEFASIKIEDILKGTDILVLDTTQERNGRPLGKNYIHFKGKGKNGNIYEGYLTFSNSAIEDGLRKYISMIYAELN